MPSSALMLSGAAYDTLNREQRDLLFEGVYQITAHDFLFRHRNEKWSKEVRDLAHHLYEVSEKLGLPFYYIEKTDSEVFSIGSWPNNPWRITNDFVD